MLFTLFAFLAISGASETNFQAYILCSAIYFYLSQLEVKTISSFRKAFISFGVVYFCGAIDQAVYYHFEIDTYFDRIQPYLVTMVNAYVLALLIDGGGKQDAGFVDYFIATFNRCLARLSLHKESNKHLSNRETK